MEYGRNEYTLDDAKKKEILNQIEEAIKCTKLTRSMVESQVDCSEVLIVLSAAKKAVNDIGKEMLKQYLNMCLMDAVKNGNSQSLLKLNKAMEYFVK